MNSRIIGNFPIPFERELFDHTISRACDQMHGLSLRAKSERLWGRVYWINKFIPKNLTTLSKRLGGILTPWEIYQENTIFPFYNLFMSAKQQQNFVRGYLNQEPGVRNLWPKALSAASGKIRYCPLCVLEQGDHPYPRVEWQLPEIEVCFKHHCFLKEYPLDENETGKPLIPVMQKERLSTEAEFCYSDPLNKLADLAAELFKYPPLVFCRHDLRLRAKTLLQRKGYLGGSSINIKKLYHDLETYYSREILEKFEAVIEDFNSYNNWINRTINNESVRVCPIYWLLLIGFLSPDFNSFLSTTVIKEDYSKCYSKARKFCPNPGCPNYGSLSNITLLSFRSFKHGRRIREVFRCNDCQMVYTVINGNYGTRLQHGPLWFQALHEKFESGELPCKIKKEFKIQRLDYYLSVEDFIPFDTKISRLREMLLRFTDQKGSVRDNLKKFRRCYNKEYQYLINNDSVWFDKTFPGGRRNKFYLFSICSDTEDIKILTKLQLAALTLKKKGLKTITQKDLINQVQNSFISLLEYLPRANEFLKRFPK